MHVSSDLYVPCRLTVIRTSFVHGAFDGAPELASGCKTLASKASRQSARVPHSWSCEAGGSKNYISAGRVITALAYQPRSLSKYSVRPVHKLLVHPGKSSSEAPHGAQN